SERVDRSFGWSSLPRYLAVVVLLGLRTTLRLKNLHDTSALPTVEGSPDPVPPGQPDPAVRTADGSVNDLGTIDVLRNRERGVPRYNEFRRLLHKRPVSRFEDLSSNRDWNEQIRSV